MYTVTSDQMLAIYKFDDTVLAFMDTELGATLLASFSPQDRETRDKLARCLREGWHPDNASQPVVFFDPAVLPVAIPAHAVIAMPGWVKRYGMPDAPSLDREGFPEDPAACMAVLDRLDK